jgi:aspartokinase
MTSIAKQVWDLINEDVVVRRALEKRIIGMKGLALYLIKEHRLNASADAVISAIRRYGEHRPLEKEFERAKKVIGGSSDIRITTNIANISIEKNRKTQELLQKVFSLVDYEKGELLLVIEGEESIKLLINEKNKAKLLAIFPPGAIRRVEGGLAEINIHLSDEASKTPGIISVLSTELTINDINIVEIMSCLPEMLFFINQKDVGRSYPILAEMCKL